MANGRRRDDRVSTKLVLPAGALVAALVVLALVPVTSLGAFWGGFFGLGDLDRFDSVITSSGSVVVSDEHVAAGAGNYSAKATYVGGGIPGRAAVGVNVSWESGDDAWYSASFYLPDGFKAAQSSPIALERWDNSATYGAFGDYGGIFLGSDHRARIVKGKLLGTEEEVIAGPFDVPEQSWSYVEVHQRLGAGTALTEVFLNGDRVAASTKPNTYGRGVDRVLVGLAEIAQLQPTRLWFDRVLVDLESSELSACPWKYAPSPSIPVSRRIELGDFGDAWPSACWRPYANTSPLNRPLPANPELASNSSAVVDRLLSDPLFDDGPGDKDVGDEGTEDDWSPPLYYAKSTDPVFRAHCTRDWGTCEPEGDEIHIPDRAKPAGGGDAHLAVIQPDGDEYDFWKVSRKDAGGGVLESAWGGTTRIDGDGLDSNASAAHIGLAGGRVRAQELAAGLIDHALLMVTKCVNGSYVYPAESASATPCTEFGSSNANAPALGAHFYIDYTPAEIEDLPVATWKKTILRALARYGMFISDTGGSGWSYGSFEGGMTYRSFGVEDRMVTYAREHGLPSWTSDGRTKYLFDMESGVDWSRLRVVNPCVSRGTC
jgi:hypothetical protein